MELEDVGEREGPGAGLGLDVLGSPGSAGPRDGLPAPRRTPLPEQGAAPERGAAEDTHDALLRRLRELGEPRRDGALTEEEFTLAKRAVLDRM